MKILKIWPSFQQELKYHDHYLADIMSDNNIETTFLCSDKVDIEFKDFIGKEVINAGVDYYNNSKIIRLKSIEFINKPFIYEISKFYKVVCSNKYDIIHIYGTGNPITFYTLFLLKFFGKNTPVFINDHSNPNIVNNSLIGNIYYKLNSFFFSFLKKYNVKRIFVPNAASYEFVMNRYKLNSNELKIIPLGYDSDTFKYNPLKKNKSKNFIIGFAGKIYPEKRLELLIDVLTDLKIDAFELILVGIGSNKTSYQKKLTNSQDKNNINVTFKKIFKKSEELADFYNYVDLVVFPGSISITSIEATGCGTPIILFNSIKGLHDRVENGRGVLFNTREELTRHLLYFYKNYNLINNENIEIETQIYSWKNISKTYLNEYNRFLDEV
jgi:glycosyltransferase involved in cell wall biosynthesis